MLFKFNLPDREEIRNSPNGLKMLRFIEDETDCFGKIITGCPGSGKTTISIYRFLYLLNKGEVPCFLTFQKMLVHSIQNLIEEKTNCSVEDSISTFHQWFSDCTGGAWFSNYENAKDLEIITIFRSNYNGGELIVDEAQDLPQKVFSSVTQLFDRITIGADNAQKIHKQGADEEEIKGCLERINKGLVKNVELQYNYRNSYEIYNFARQFIPFDPRAKDKNLLKRLEKNRSDPPVIYLVDSDKVKFDRLTLLLKNLKGNIAVLLPNKDNVDYYHKRIISSGINCSHYRNGLTIPKNLKRIVVTTFKSAKGLEFDVVILPLVNSLSDKEQIRREYYVACTRARHSLCILCFKKVHDVFSTFEPNSFEVKDLRCSTSLV